MKYLCLIYDEESKLAGMSKSESDAFMLEYRAFTQSITSGKSFDTTLQTLALRLSSLSVSAALRPVTNSLTGGLNSLFSGLFGGSGTSAANPGKGLAAEAVLGPAARPPGRSALAELMMRFPDGR